MCWSRRAAQDLLQHRIYYIGFITAVGNGVGSVLLSSVGIKLEEAEIGVWAHAFKEKSPWFSGM